MTLQERFPLYLQNSLSRSKEKFEPINAPNVGMYVCGPTVYSEVHIGNVRTFITFDVLYRYLTALGYKVRYVRNITDVGHILDDSGEDRIAKRAKLEKLEPMEIVQKYTNYFHRTMELFNNLEPSIEPTATGHIIEQIEFVQEILDNGFAYESNGSVYFDVEKYNLSHHYGSLSGRKIEDLISNTRDLDGQDEKQNPLDFAIWKKAEKQHIMRWPSPWSEGFPGWHLECSVMSTKYLGETFDIHGGGMDLKFPHHECEIAQAEACNDSSPVNYWLHANMLTLNGKKMAKSTGNNILPGEIFTGDNDKLSKAFSPMVIRFFMMQAHYASILDISDEAVLASEKGYNKLMEAVSNIDKLSAEAKSSWEVNSWIQKCFDAMNDDFNTPILIANLFEAVKQINLMKDGKEQLNSEDLENFKNVFKGFIFEVLGLLNQSEESSSSKLPDLVELLIELRNKARVNKDFATSDQIRDQLAELGIVLKDGKEGTSYTIQ